MRRTKTHVRLGKSRDYAYCGRYIGFHQPRMSMSEQEFRERRQAHRTASVCERCTESIDARDLRVRLAARRDQIIAYLRAHPGSTAKEVAIAVGRSRQSVSTSLCRLRGEGRVDDGATYAHSQTPIRWTAL